MKSVMKHQFSQVPKAEIQRSSFDRSHGFKTTFSAGYLVPIFVDEALPGDTFNLRCNFFARLSTPITPFMDNLFLDYFFFAVPNRLVWDNWQKFMGEQTNPGESTDYLVPTMTSPANGYDVGTLSDYFGLPTNPLPSVSAQITHSSLWHRAYNLIWNEWFRDQNMQDSVVVDKDDGPDTYTDYVLLRRGKRHDYFTSCLPWPQKGPAVTLPLGTSAPVYGAELTGTSTTSEMTAWQARSNPGGVTGAGKVFVLGGGPPASVLYGDANLSNREGLSLATAAQYASLGGTFEPPYADLSEATAATINALRQAFQLQRLYERDARGGTRYTEIIKAHFGVTSPDARLQRPEYLGGGSAPIQVNPVAATAQVTGVAYAPANLNVGDLGAMATVQSTGSGFSKSFTEHTLIIGLVSVRADLNYQQGLNRMWSRQTRWDYYWPALAHIGEQAVLQKEIYAGTATDDDDVFGYQERYAEYRYKPSLITGQFRSTYPQSLDIWHLAQDFGAAPTLNDSFVQENPPLDRVLATQAIEGYPQFLFDAYMQLKCARPMPVYSVPGLIDHF